MIIPLTLCIVRDVPDPEGTIGRIGPARTRSSVDRGCLLAALVAAAPLDRDRVGARAEAHDRVVAELDAVGDPRGIEDQDVVAGLAALLELGDLERARGDRVAVLAERGRGVGARVAGLGDLDLEDEADRLAALETRDDVVAQVVAAARLGLLARDRP